MKKVKIYLLLLLSLLGTLELFASSSIDTSAYIDKINYYKEYLRTHNLPSDTVTLYAHKGIELSSLVMDTSSLVEFYIILGDIEQRKKRRTQVLEAYSLAQNLISSSRQREEYANLSRKIGGVHWQLGNYAKASHFFNNALFHYKNLGLALEVGKTYNNLGTIAKELSKNDSSLYYYDKAVKIFSEIDNQELKASTLNLIGNIYLVRKMSKQALESYKKSLLIRRSLGDSIAVSQSLTNIARVYKDALNFDLSLKYIRLALDIRQTYNELALEASSLNDIGIVYKDIGNYASSIDYFQRALVIRRQIDLKDQIAASLLNVGSIYLQFDLGETALSYYLEALEIYQKLGDERRISICLNYIGGVYYKKKEYDNALDYFLSSLGYREVSGNKNEIADLLNNIAMIYKNMGNYNKSLEYYTNALDYYSKLGNTHKHAATLNHIGNLYKKQNKNSIALKWLKKAYYERRKINDLNGFTHSGLDIGQIYMSEHKYKAAYAYLNKALENAKMLKCFGLNRDVYFAMYKLAEQQNKYKKALDYHVYYDIWKDSVFNDQTLKNLSKVQLQNETEHRRIQIDYENKQKQREIDRLNKNREERELYYQLKTESGRRTRNYTIFIAISLLLVLILLVNRYVVKVKTNRKLKKFNDDLSKLNNSLIKSQTELTRINATKDKFFSIIAHDLRSPFTALVSMSEFLYDNNDTIENNEKKELLYQINIAAQNTYQLLENLLEWSKTQQGQLKFNAESLDLYDLVEEIVAVQLAAANQKDIKVSVQMNTHINVCADKHMISFVIRNIISNAIKFTPHSGQIIISANEIESNAIIQVSDTGIGMSRRVIEQLFDLNNHYIAEGTNKEKGAGLGLILVKEFIEQHEGFISVQSTPGQGSIFKILIPLKN